MHDAGGGVSLVLHKQSKNESCRSTSSEAAVVFGGLVLNNCFVNCFASATSPGILPKAFLDCCIGARLGQNDDKINFPQ